METWRDFVEVDGFLELELEKEGFYFFDGGKEGCFSVVSPVRLHLTFEREKGGVKVSGRMATCLSFVCSRCLREFRTDVDEVIDVFFSEEGVFVREEGEEIELKESDLDVEFVSPGSPINLKELVEEEIRLLVPYKPLCNPECKGLCSRCGFDLNLGECGCEPEVDPRLAPLLELKKKLAGGG